MSTATATTDETKSRRLLNFYTSAVIDIENIFKRANQWNNEPGRLASEMIDADPSDWLGLALQDLKYRKVELEAECSKKS